MDIRSRPKGDYLRNALWTELYDLTKHLKTEFDFYRDEISFLRILLDKNLNELTHDISNDELKAITTELTHVDAEYKSICSLINLQLHELKALIEDDEFQDEQQFRDEHAQLEDTYSHFVIMLRNLKRNIFFRIEHIMKLKKEDHLLSNR